MLPEKPRIMVEIVRAPHLCNSSYCPVFLSNPVAPSLELFLLPCLSIQSRSSISGTSYCPVFLSKPVAPSLELFLLPCLSIQSRSSISGTLPIALSFYPIP
ncbi:hypothetical protein RRG08_065902 [Elysia crispata]|uniref:Uncharacterized protein n=1 Tax=Elysia crispata TaxID=231223 RepID=A0AAE1AM36_9GAST|nr:hypothetical protein RRG08_065902 [Elysia crispata]